MAIFPSLIKRGKEFSPSPSDDFWYFAPQLPTNAGISIDETNALKYLTVLACVTLISGDVGRLPLNLYRKRKDGGKDSVTDHRLYDLLHHAPNNEMTSFNWRETAQGHLLLWGNHYSYIERNMTGEVIGLWPLPDPGKVNVKRKNNNLVYEYWVDTERRARTRNEIFHIPGYGFNGIVGKSMIAMAREAVGFGLAIEKFGSMFFGKGTHPSIAVTIPPEVDLGDQEKEYKEKLKAAIAGIENAHGIAVFSNGETFEKFTMPLEDAQFLETRDHQKIEICGMYHVPPHKIAIHGQNSNYNNLEQENQSYVDSCLTHWLTRWESQISLQLLTEKERRSGLFFEFLVAGLLRGDSKARAEFYNKIFQVGGISPNEIRAKENMNPDPSEAADKKYVMLNMIPLDQADEMAQKPEEQSKEETQQEQDIRSLAKFFSADKGEIIRLKKIRSIRTRDRIAKRYRPLILNAAESIVNREVIAIKKQILGRKVRENRNTFESFLTDFYEKFPEYINMKMGPVLRSYIETIIDESVSEMGVDEINLDQEIREYIQGYADRHTSGSLGQLTALLDGELSDIEARADEWVEKRPEKIVDDELVRASSAGYSWVAFGAGLSIVWRIRGAKTCPYCQSLDGKRIARGQSFVSGGDEIDLKDGTGPMRFYGIKAHPPLHQKCDCYISAV